MVRILCSHWVRGWKCYTEKSTTVLEILDYENYSLFLFPSFQFLPADAGIFLPATAPKPTLEDQQASCPGGTVGAFS